MLPVPSRRHQEISRDLFREMDKFLFGKSCNIYLAPFDVRLSEKSVQEKEITSVV